MTAYHSTFKWSLRTFASFTKSGTYWHNHSNYVKHELADRSSRTSTALKHDLGYSPAELVYASTLRLPGEFFTSGSEEPAQDPMTNANQLQSTVRKLRLTLLGRQSRAAVYVSNKLDNCSHVFLRQDDSERSLRQPYSGPHKVLSRGAKTFTIDYNGRQ